MPKITTIEYDRAEVEALVRQAYGLGFDRRDVREPVIGPVGSKGVLIWAPIFYSREALAAFVQATDEDAQGKQVKVAALGAKGMTVRLTQKEAAEEAGG